MVPGPDDYQLMQLVAQGDAQALAKLYDRYSPLIYAMCLRVLGNRAEADELLPEIFFEVWEKRARYDAARSAPRTYLTMLARSRAIDRKRKRGLSITSQIQENDAIDRQSPAEMSINSEQRVAIVKAVAQLDSAQREAIECAFYDGLSHSEIAQKLDRPLGTIKTCIRQGLIRLREIVRNAYEEPNQT